MAANATQIVDPAIAWAAIVGPFIVGLIGSFVAWVKRNDPLVPPATPPAIPAAPASPDPALLAVQEANAKMLAMIDRHTKTADDLVADYARENGELRRENADLKDRNADLRQQLGIAEKEITNLNSKVEVLQIRLDERGRRG